MSATDPHEGGGLEDDDGEGGGLEGEGGGTENEITESANVTTENRKESGKPGLPHVQRLLHPA